MSDCVNHSRRGFIAKVALASTVTIAPGLLLHTVEAKPADQAVTSKTRWGMLIDTSKCSKGCSACVEACDKEFALTGSMPESSPGQKTQYIRKVSLTNKSTGHELSLPVMCQHCGSAPCTDVCPTGASFKRADGIVLVDKHICIGCRYCMMACPYKARSFVDEVIHNQTLNQPRGIGTVESCNMCVRRVDNGEIPACVEACSAKDHKAMLFGDLNDPNSEISTELRTKGGVQLRADLGLDTGVRYQGV